jgi:hypothetical protein
MINATAWRPAGPAPPPPPPPGLAAALEERDTVIVLVIGAGPDSDQAERRCRGLALDPGFEAVRVVRVRDRAELSGPQRAYWLETAPWRSSGRIAAWRCRWSGPTPSTCSWRWPPWPEIDPVTSGDPDRQSH